MRTSLNKIKRIDDHLFGNGNVGDGLLFEAHIALDSELKESVHLQKQTYRLIGMYGRKKLRNEIEDVHQQLFSDPKHNSFKKKIMSIFFNRNNN